MNRVAVVGTGLLGLLLLIGVTLGDPQDTSDAAGPPDEPAAVTTVPDRATEEADQESETAVPTRTVDQDMGRRARSVRIDKDGFVYGYVHYVDPHSLEQVPVANAVITFMQNCDIVTQAKSGADGRFSVKGLSPYAAYSMFVRSDLWVCMLGTYVLPEEDDEVSVEASETAAAGKKTNSFLFASQSQVAEVTDNSQSAEGNPRYHAIQVVPLGDFICAINQGLFGDICGGVAGGSCCPPPAGGAGGGGGGAGYGGAAAAAFAAAAAAWGTGVGTDDNELASPFRPR
jgi:hypothetical protein